MELEGKKVIVLAEEIYNEQELWYPYYRLLEAGAEVTLVGTGSAKTYRGKFGIPVTVDADAKDIDPASYDGVVIPGGYAPDKMRLSKPMVGLVRTLNESGKVIAAICHAGWMLASAGVARGKTLTSYVAIRDDLVHAGAEWVDDEVVVDGNLVTSRTPADLPAFMRETIRLLAA